MQMTQNNVAGVLAGGFVALCLVTATAQEDPPESARIWQDRAEELEQFIREAAVVDIEEIGVGVTNPQRADLEPGGPVDRIAFKPLRPGNYRGHFESYTHGDRRLRARQAARPGHDAADRRKADRDQGRRRRLVGLARPELQGVRRSPETPESRDRPLEHPAHSSQDVSQPDL